VTPYLTVLVKIPEESYPPISLIQQDLERIDARHVPSPPSYLHITLKVIGSLGGSIKESRVPKIIEAIARVANKHKRFAVDFAGLGIFPDVIYLRIEEGTQELKKIHLSLLDELKGLAVGARFEGPDMIPHVTLLHFATKDIEPLVSHATALRNVKVPSIEVSEITLVKSHTYRLLEDNELLRGSVLEKVASFMLL